jgi:hypothetical protein
MGTVHCVETATHTVCGEEWRVYGERGAVEIKLHPIADRERPDKITCFECRARLGLLSKKEAAFEAMRAGYRKKFGREMDEDFMTVEIARIFFGYEPGGKR